MESVVWKNKVKERGFVSLDVVWHREIGSCSIRKGQKMALTAELTFLMSSQVYLSEIVPAKIMI